MSNALQRFKKRLETNIYFRTKTHILESQDDKTKSVVIEVELPVVWEWEVDPNMRKGYFQDYRVKCRVLGTNRTIFHHFNLLVPLTPMEVIAWASSPSQ